MSFQLKNFEAHLPSDILTKGKNYREEGNVDNLAEDGGTWTAYVYGTNDYTVEVEITNGEVTDWSCDCPYDWGDTCKHVAAVLFAVRNEAPQTPDVQPVAKRRGRKPKPKFGVTASIGFTPVTPTSTTKEKPDTNNPVRQIIDKLDATELRSIMHYLAQREGEVKAYLLTKYAHLITVASKSQYSALVKSIIDANGGGRRGFIDYREASRLGDRLYKLLADAKEPMGSLPLVYLCVEVVQQLAEAYQSADDSSGSMGSAMEQAFSLLQEMAENEATPADVVRYIFEYALKESSNKDYQGWDWASNLRSIACAAVRTRAEAEHLVQVLDQSIRADSKEKYRNYAIEKAELLKLDLIKKFESEKAAEAYLLSRLHHTRFREKALENAMQAGRHDEVQHLANDGIAQDSADKPGLVTRWKQWLIRLAEATGDTLAQAAHLEALYLDRGEMSYYRELKQLLPKADFDKKWSSTSVISGNGR